MRQGCRSSRKNWQCDENGAGFEEGRIRVQSAYAPQAGRVTFIMKCHASGIYKTLAKYFLVWETLISMLGDDLMVFEEDM